MKSYTDREVIYSKGKNDEYYTLDYGVKPILKYIPNDWTVWCPFDTEESEFVKQIRKNGNKVIHSHIMYGQDFYKYEPEEEWEPRLHDLLKPPFLQTH